MSTFLLLALMALTCFGMALHGVFSGKIFQIFPLRTGRIFARKVEEPFLFWASIVWFTVFGSIASVLPVNVVLHLVSR